MSKLAKDLPSLHRTGVQSQHPHKKQHVAMYVSNFSAGGWGREDRDRQFLRFLGQPAA